MELSILKRSWILVRYCLICSLIGLLVFGAVLFRFGRFELLSFVYGWLLIHLGLFTWVVLHMGTPDIYDWLFFLIIVGINSMCILTYMIRPIAVTRKVSFYGIIAWYLLGLLGILGGI